MALYFLKIALLSANQNEEIFSCILLLLLTHCYISDPKQLKGKEIKDDECSICLCEFTKKKTLDKCGHSFCTKCIDKAFKTKKQCPICSMVYGPLTGNQPPGNMFDSYRSTSLPGFKSSGAIIISYRFPSGMQGLDHPNPGKPYAGTSRTAYLPDNKEGRKVLRLLKKAFEQKLTFTIGRSTTTGRDDFVTWNDIHHKTSMYGGSTGYVKYIVYIARHHPINRSD